MNWLKQLFIRHRRYDELSASIRDHLEEKIADLMDRGMTRTQAEHAARRNFGNVTVIEERSREVWQWPTLDGILADIRFASRQLRRAPGFLGTAVLTLALGIGATTAIFTLVNALLLRSLPVKSPAELWRVGDNEQCCNNGGLPDATDGGIPNDWSLFSYEQYQEFRGHTLGFESLAAFQSNDPTMSVRREGGSHPAQPLPAEYVSGNSFDTLGLRAYSGRLLEPADDVRGAAPVAVMSFSAWEQKFGRDPSVVGSSFIVNGQPLSVVGIAPPGFFGERMAENPPGLWLPLNLNSVLTADDQIDHPEIQWLNLIGRVKPGTAIEPIQSQMNVELAEFLRSPLSKITGAASSLIPRQYLHLSHGDGGVRRMQNSYKNDLRLLMWTSSFVLMIACANLANLMLSRSVTQRQQTAVRNALGASRGRLVRRALVECLLLALLGGIAGVLVAWCGARLILRLAFERNPVTIDPTPSLAVLGFAIGASLLTGLLFGLAPAWSAAHANPIEALRRANRSTGRHTTLAQKALVATQAAVSLVLLSAAGFLILSMSRLERQDFGFETANRYIVEMAPEIAGYRPGQLKNFYREIEEAVAAILGVEHVAFSLVSPMSGGSWGEGVFIEGRPVPGLNANVASAWDRVSPDYFNAVGTKLIAGRSFTRADDATRRDVAIVNQTFVKKFLPGMNPIGARFGDWDASVTSTYEIVGVVQDAQYWDPSQPVRPMYFLPAAQSSQLPPSHPRSADYAHFIAESQYLSAVVIETRGNVPELEAQVRRALAQVNPNLIFGYRSFAEQVAQNFSQQATIAELTSLFGIVALVLAAIGLYGVIAYAVAQQTREIGIRMALGANRAQVQKMVVYCAFEQIGLGLLVGVPAAIATGRFMASKLFSVTAYNPMVLGAGIAVLAVAALLATLLPAKRAASVDPMEALRME